MKINIKSSTLICSELLKELKKKQPLTNYN